MLISQQDYTLTPIFNHDLTHVLMCEHQKIGKLNFVGGKKDPGEDIMSTQYRELEEETGIVATWIEQNRLTYVLNMIVETSYDEDYIQNPCRLHLCTGILKEGFEDKLVAEKNPLKWVDIHDDVTFINAHGDGRCMWFLLASMRALNIVQRGIIDITIEPYIEDKKSASDFLTNRFMRRE